MKGKTDTATSDEAPSRYFGVRMPKAEAEALITRTRAEGRTMTAGLVEAVGRWLQEGTHEGHSE
jgi:hypothetical protein